MADGLMATESFAYRCGAALSTVIIKQQPEPFLIKGNEQPRLPLHFCGNLLLLQWLYSENVPKTLTLRPAPPHPPAFLGKLKCQSVLATADPEEEL